MEFELRKLKIVAALSEETACYTAEIWIDGSLAFHASNRGQGGADHYRQAGVHSEAEVNAWLASNRSVRTYQGLTLKPDLEHEVARLMDEAENRRALRRKLRTHLITIEGGEVFTYPLKKRSAVDLAKFLQATRPMAQVVNGAGDAALTAAVRLLLDQSIRDEDPG